jgi:hypothetical protein
MRRSYRTPEGSSRNRTVPQNTFWRQVIYVVMMIISVMTSRSDNWPFHHLIEVILSCNKICGRDRPKSENNTYEFHVTITVHLHQSNNFYTNRCTIKTTFIVAFINTGYTQKNGAVSLYSPLKPHHSFVYTLYIPLHMFRSSDHRQGVSFLKATNTAIT